jgi:hypothetical protein
MRRRTLGFAGIAVVMIAFFFLAPVVPSGWSFAMVPPTMIRHACGEQTQCLLPPGAFRSYLSITDWTFGFGGYYIYSQGGSLHDWYYGFAY